MAKITIYSVNSTQRALLLNDIKIYGARIYFNDKFVIFSLC